MSKGDNTSAVIVVALCLVVAAGAVYINMGQPKPVAFTASQPAAHNAISDDEFAAAGEVDKLAKHYDALKIKTHRTTAESKEMQDTLNALSVKDPGLVAGYTKDGDAIAKQGRLGALTTAKLNKMMGNESKDSTGAQKLQKARAQIHSGRYGEALDELAAIPLSDPARSEVARLMDVAREQEIAAASEWKYSEEEDAMGRGKIKTAFVVSSNTVEFAFPYARPQHARLELRRHPKYGDDVILSIERGQFMEGVYSCDVSVSFDGSTPRMYKANRPADDSTTAVFLQGFSRFVSTCKRAKTMRIEAPFYQEGEQVFSFNVGGLHWQ